MQVHFLFFTSFCYGEQNDFMAVKYKLRQCTNQKSEDYGSYYAQAVMTGECNLNQLSERVQRNCSMKKSDVLAVLTEMVEVLKDELQASHKVVIEGLGTFKIGIKGTYAKTAAAYNASKNISGFKVNFRPQYSLEKTGTYTDEEGNVKVKKAAIAELTQGIQVQAY